MPRKIFRRWLPDPQRITNHRGLRWLGPAIADPYLFHINRTSVSKSFLIGVFCCYLPLPGQTLIAALLALSFRSNLPLAVALIWISNPVTMPAMFYLSYKFGTWVLGTPESSNFNFELSWDWVVAQGSNIILPLFTGSLIFGLVLGLSSFFVIRYLWRWKVIKNWEKRKAFRLQRREQNLGVSTPRE